MAGTSKTRVLALAKSLDLSESYGALLHLAAVMGSDSKTLIPETEEERLTWEGHMLGLVAALHCVAMQERQLDPGTVAEIVDIHLNQARHILSDPESGS